jgi:energy-coupling factor transporter ATP-binding protein EcfA2
MRHSNYPKGSEWRKWDLHVHTPYSIVNHYKGKDNDEKWEKFISDLENLPPEFKVLGINDYLFIDGYRKMLEYKEKGRLKNIELLLPVVEFRLEKFAGHKELKKVNLHVIFSNELTPDIIQKQFLDAITNNFKLTPGINGIMWSGVISKESLEDLGKKIKESAPKDKLADYGSDLEEGFNNLCVNEDEIIKILVNNSYLKEKYLIAIGKTEWESLSWNNQSIAIKKDIINKANIVFISVKDIDSFNNSKVKLKEQNVNDLLLDCSDAHYNSDSQEKDRIGKCFTWIKADPTFEGLKQIIYEPEERVRIQENNPEYDFDKPAFSKINIIQPIEVFNGEKVKFNKTELPLNKNLVTIIGGRGTGKSLLLNFIANVFKIPILAYQNKDKPIHFNESEHFVIEWQKSNTPKSEKITFNAKDKGDLDLIFIEQGKLKNISDYKILANEIKKVLKIGNLQFDENLDKEIKGLLDGIKKLKEWFEYKNEKGEKINDRQFNENKKQEAENLLKTITTANNKDNLEIYTSNVKSINNCENILSRLREIKNNLDKFQDDINNTINNVNSDIQNEIKDIIIPKIDFQSQTNAIKIIQEKITTIIKDKKEKNNEIKKEFEKQGYKGDLETLLSNAEKYQKNIQEAEVKLKEIEEREKQLNERLQQRNNLDDKLKKEYERQKKEIDNAWNNLLNNFSNEQRKLISKILEKREISIEGEIYFNLKAFNEKLKEYLDLRTYKNLSEDIGINSIDDYWNFIKNTLKNFIEGKEKEKTKKELEDLFFNLQERKDYLYVIPRIKSMNKTLDQLSVGQRGTLYLLLQLATNTFSSPLIFDQPEDDLDNEFITKELVGLFKELKKYRQIIISTHNANLVVTADAEQVIVANNNNETLTYISGSLENSEIIRYVCEILEGGIDAFRKRERKYNIKI